ncbi:MAG: hypothetical protein CMP96_04355 [Gammaproteobacteria bacterium]|nr:hypothetical protein [Gammaproteobacteria bacterium]
MSLRLLLLGLLALPLQAHSVTIMAFNVENLFDATHDRGKNDETYLPLTEKTKPSHINKCNTIKVERWRQQCLTWDWSASVVNRKLKVLGDTIKQVNQGLGPDIIALQEIENIEILERLRTEQLAGLGYQPSVLLEGKDLRGIDVAFLSKFRVIDSAHHEIVFSKALRARVGDTRPILSATFELPSGEQLIGYSVHFPAPFHPTVMREHAYQTLNTLLASLPASQAVFAAGDFNTTSDEDREHQMLARWVRPHWQVAHDLCDGCRGTNYYPPKKNWSFLDMVLWRSGAEWRLSKAFLANRLPAQISTYFTAEGTPNRFRLPEATGVSDHWPLVLEVKRQNESADITE